jgi:hypothetical protein
LTLASGLTFEQISGRFAQMTRRHLVVEFMPNGLGVSAPVPNPLPRWYTLEGFLDSLRKCFSAVEVIPWNAERAASAGPRVLVHCAGPRSPA